MPKLFIKVGENKGAVLRLTDQKFTIGRDPANTLVLADRRVSRTHAAIFCEGGQYTMEDLGSVNGVYVNNALITKKILNEGDEIKIGSTVLNFLSLEAPERMGVRPDPCSVQILPEGQAPQGLTIEFKIPSSETRAWESQVENADNATLEKAYQRLVVLYRLSHDLGTVLDLTRLLDRILESVLTVMHADRGFVMLRDKTGGELGSPVVRQREGLPAAEIAVSKTILQQVLESGEAVLTSDAQQDERFKEAQSIVFHGIRSAMCVPIRNKTNILGIIHIDSQGKEILFSKPDLELLTAIASQAAMAVENAQVVEDLKQANREIQERQKLLIEAEKMSALGRLAGGVAHEINNPLTSVMGYAGLVKDKLSNPDKITPTVIKECIESLKVVEEEAHHCGNIAQTLLQFGRRKKAEMGPTDINAVIKGTLLIAKFHIKKVAISLQENLEPNLPQVLGNADQLQQVFLNFIINARDAMEKSGGKLMISTNVKDRWVEIQFADTGCGIPADKLEEIFKPLYTTKEEGKGTGLGLSISQEIMEMHQGTIEVESALGQGTTFILRLPIKS